METMNCPFSILNASLCVQVILLSLKRRYAHIYACCDVEVGFALGSISEYSKLFSILLELFDEVVDYGVFLHILRQIP